MRYDLESAVMTGTIIERQKDRNTGEWKYRISGEAVSGVAIEVIVKLGATGKVVFITVYLP